MRRISCWLGHSWVIRFIDYPDTVGRHRTCIRCRAEDEVFNILSDAHAVLVQRVKKNERKVSP